MDDQSFALTPALVGRLLAMIERLGRDALELCEDPAMPPASRAALERARAAVAERLRLAEDGASIVRLYLFDGDTLAAAAERALDRTMIPAVVAVDAAFATRLRDLRLECGDAGAGRG
jgi:hypothetical protein